MNIHEEALQRYPVNSQPNGVSWTDASGFKREAFVAGAEWARKEALAEAAVELAAVRARRVKERDALVRRIWVYRDERDALKARVTELEAVIQKALTFDGRQTVDGITDRGYLSPDEWREEKIMGILGSAPSVVLGEHDREVRAREIEAWRDDLIIDTHPGDATTMRTNDIHSWLTERAAAIRNGEHA